MGLFSREKDAEPYTQLPASPSPQYVNNQPTLQLYPSCSQPTQQYASQQQNPPPNQPSRTPSQSPYPNGLNPANQNPPPPAFSTPQPRTLHITRSGLSQRHAQIHESDNLTQAYTMHSSYAADWIPSKSNLEIISSSTNELIGSITFHSMSRRIDLNVNGQMISLKSEGLFTRGYSFGSSVGVLKWEAAATGSAYACTTRANRAWLARCDQDVFRSRHGKGTLEIVSWDLPQRLMEELVVSGLAMIEYERRYAVASAGAEMGAGA
ncbi:MAG: hypothetical protein Q9208_001387 [Pyrenodesmia sp. 3 TL-2023]